MVGDKWIIRWREYLSDSYAYGSKIKFNNNKVEYLNELMPPGTVLHTWYSKTNYQSSRVEPTLPLIDGESAYSLALKANNLYENGAGLMLRVVFIDRYDQEIENEIIRGGEGCFKPPITTYSFKIELISGNCKEFIFESLTLQEISGEEFDAKRKCFEENKKYSKAGKKSRRKNKETK